jgi:hypothetical protein
MSSPPADEPATGPGLSGRIHFERLPPTSLPKFVHFNRFPRASLLPEDNGSGCAWGDYDGDGDDDLFLCNINGPYLMAARDKSSLPGSCLWRNDRRGRFADVTESCGLGEPHMDMGAVFADFDNDGDADLLVTSLSGIRLYRNDSARFTNVTEAVGLGGVTGYCLGAAWGDYDRDGRLDLYICRYVNFPVDKARKRPLVAGRPAPMTTPANYPPVRNYLFHQRTDGTFRDVTEASGTADPDGRSMQAVWCDFDNDGWVDLYVANDQSLDCLFHNRHDGTFEEVALTYGVFDPRGGMGVAVIDHQADGDQDLLVTHWVAEDPAFYVNRLDGGVCLFEDMTPAAGLRKHDGALVGWGTEFVDFDNDGDRDLFIVRGSTIEDELTLDVLSEPKMLPQRSSVYEFHHNRWHLLGEAAGTYFGQSYVGRGAAVSDFDLDGRPDIAINNHGDAPALLRNVSRNVGHALKLRLTGRDCNRDAANARVTVRCEGAKPQLRELLIGSSYLSGHTKTLHFGLGRARSASRVTVRWPCGRIESFRNLPADRILEITEGKRGQSP